VTTFRCGGCEGEHVGPPLAYGAAAPYGWERSLDDFEGVLSGEQAVLFNDGLPFAWFMKGNIEIPIRETDEVFVWTVWVSLSGQSFDACVERWDAPDRADDPARFGWLWTELPVYATCFQLKTMMHTRAPGIRPYIEVEPTDHPLAVEQHHGVTMSRVEAIASTLLHSNG
jgi:hypothetical protein